MIKQILFKYNKTNFGRTILYVSYIVQLNISLKFKMKYEGFWEDKRFMLAGK